MSMLSVSRLAVMCCLLVVVNVRICQAVADYYFFFKFID